MTSNSSKFWTTMDEQHGNLRSNHTKTRNGAHGFTAHGMATGAENDPYDSLKGLFVALFTNLTRGYSRSEVVDDIRDILRLSNTIETRSWAITRLIKLAFQTRDTRGGKGEKDLSRWILLCLYEYVPGLISAVVTLLPEYGYWKDIPLMIADIKNSGREKSMRPLLDALYDILVSTIQKDLYLLKKWQSDGSHPSYVPSLSLVAKFVPKENRAYDRRYKVSKELAKRMFPSAWSQDYRSALRNFRKSVSQLNRFLDTTEIKMSGKRYREIDFNRVPSKCLAKNRKAFLNKKMGPGRKEIDRYPVDQDRIACRSNLLDHMERVKKGDPTAKIHGKQLTPYDIVHSLIDVSGYHSNLKSLSQEELDLIDLQFKNLRSKLVDQPSSDALKHATIYQQGSMSRLNRTVPMIDVSGSMIGYGDAVPLKAAIGLGLTLATLGNPPFSHRFLTFHSHPSWVELNPEWPIHRMVKVALDAPWGGSTNLLSAFDLILSHARINSLQSEDMPDRLVIFTDMDFDQNGKESREWATTYDTICSKWRAAGYGHPPEVVFWNLNAKSVAFPVKANTPGVRLISGWSIDLFKLFVADDLESYHEPTPWETLENALSDKRYNSVHEIVDLFIGEDGSIRDHPIQKKTAVDIGNHDVDIGNHDVDIKGWSFVDYTTDPPTVANYPDEELPRPKLVRQEATGAPSESEESTEDLRRQLLDLQKQQEEMMKLQQKLLAKLG